MKASNMFLPFAKLWAYILVWFLCAEAMKKFGLTKSK